MGVSDRVRDLGSQSVSGTGTRTREGELVHPNRTMRVWPQVDPRLMSEATPAAAVPPSASAWGFDSPGARGARPLSLILVAAVANLNLAVANVALPTIGKAFDSRRRRSNLIAVGYSLGLAASVLYLGAVGDRYGRKLLLVLGMALSVPACLLAAYAPSDAGALSSPASSAGSRPGMAYPTTLALITALWSGPGAHQVDRAVVGARRRDLRARARCSPGLLLEHFWWGSVFLDHPAARGGGARDGRGCFVPSPRERGDRARRQPRRHPLGRARRRADPRDQLRAGPEQGHARARPAASSRSPPLVAFYLRQRRAREPAVRPARRRAARSSGSRRLRRDHRVRLADGRDVHRPAVPAERARLLDPRGRRRDPARRPSAWC